MTSQLRDGAGELHHGRKKKNDGSGCEKETEVSDKLQEHTSG
jgi:hypothetical protein